VTRRTRATDYKRAAIECWSADPCLAVAADGQLGSRTYFEGLLEVRHEYAPWMETELDYAGAAGSDVLDVGCGQGIDLARYAIAGARVTGIDITPRHVQLAVAHLAALKLPGQAIVADAERLPFRAGSFDRVSSNGVLHHTPGMHLALREIRRVLRAGGDARIIVYNRNSFHYWLTQVLYHGIVHGKLLHERSMQGVLSSGVEYTRFGGRPLVRVYSPTEVRHMLLGSGFRRVQIGVRHYRYRDTPVTALLGRYLSLFREPRLLDRIGRIGGWYIVGRALA